MLEFNRKPAHKNLEFVELPCCKRELEINFPGKRGLLKNVSVFKLERGQHIFSVKRWRVNILGSVSLS